MQADVNFKINLSQKLYFIRGICIVLMVIGHVIGFNKEYGMRQIYNSDLSSLGWFHDFIITFHMPIFLIASGVAFTAFSNKDISYKKFARSKFAKLFIPLVCWAPIYFIFQSLSKGKQFSFLDIINAVAYPYEIFWFIHALIFASFLSFICFKVLKSKLIYFLVSIIFFILWLIFDIMYIYFFWNIFYTFGVFVAYYLHKINLKLEKIRLRTLVLIQSSLILVMVSAKHFMQVNEAINPLRIINGSIGFLFMYTLAFFFVKIIRLHKSHSKLLQPVANYFVYFGKNSMIIYLFHGYFTRSTIILLTKLFGLPNEIFYFVLVSSMGILGPIELYKFLQTRSKMFIYSVGGAK